MKLINRSKVVVPSQIIINENSLIKAIKRPTFFVKDKVFLIQKKNIFFQIVKAIDEEFYLCQSIEKERVYYRHKYILIKSYRILHYDEIKKIPRKHHDKSKGY